MNQAELDAVSIVVGLGVIVAGFILLGWHSGPCKDWWFEEHGEHVAGNGTWVRLDMNTVALVELHACLDDHGYATKTWERVADRRLSPDPALEDDSHGGPP